MRPEYPTIHQKIEEMESVMAKAKAEVERAAQAIKSLRHTLELIGPSENAGNSAKQSEQPSDDLPEILVKSTAKNAKGALTPVILQVVGDGKIRNTDEVLAAVNARMSTPTTRDSVRSTLGHLIAAGKICKPAYGKYQGISE